jgi:hypothetical protein
VQSEETLNCLHKDWFKKLPRTLTVSRCLHSGDLSVTEIRSTVRTTNYASVDYALYKDGEVVSVQTEYDSDGNTQQYWEMFVAKMLLQENPNPRQSR